MNSRRTHTEKILRDDIGWLESRIRDLEAAANTSERKLANCYKKLLHQRQQQLAARGDSGGICPGGWPDYFC